MGPLISQERVLETQKELPAFPPVILEIMAVLDDPYACLGVISRYIEQDAVVAGHILSMANRAGNTTHAGSAINDVFTAISLVGLARVRETALIIRTASFLEALAPPQDLKPFWGHSLATAVCGVELSHYATIDIATDASLMACLLHDVGKLWLQTFEPHRTLMARQTAQARRIEIDVAEREEFGVDHGQIGGWLAQSWGLSANIIKAIVHHHAPEAALAEPLVAVVHVAEVLSAALDLSPSSEAHVTWISKAACDKLSLDWGSDSQGLFGRIEARSRHAFSPVLS